MSAINWDLEQTEFEANLPISEMTDKVLLQGIINSENEVMYAYRYCRQKLAYILAERNWAKATVRLEYLNRLTVKTPPITPQLNLFK
jgi:hypothetical protein